MTGFKTEQVIGRFVDTERTPIEGMIHFIPSKIWVEDEDGVAWPCPEFHLELVNGGFLVYLARTDLDDMPWHYTVVSPVGQWTIQIADDGPLMLKKLLPDRSA